MEHNAGVGLIVGLIVASTIYVYNSKKLKKSQKLFLYLCVLFAPLQWLLIFVFLAYNNDIKNNTSEKIEERTAQRNITKIDLTIQNLFDLKCKGVLTDEEYKQKIEKLEFEKNYQNLKNSLDYKQLKSLLDSNVLTIKEFEDKVEKLKTLNNKTSIKDFRIVDGFSEGLALVINSDLEYGFINPEQKLVIQFQFEHAENFKKDYAYVRYKNAFGNIDKKGNFYKI